MVNGIQNTHKLSYYLPLHAEKDIIMSLMEDRLSNKNIKASLIWSVDEPKSMGLLDVLPQNATKLHAIRFLQQYLDYSLDEIVFAGDSGNDLPVLGSPIHSVLVENASDEVKKAAKDLAEQNGHSDALYFASARYLHMNGNYSAGVLEGVWHFVPGLRHILGK